MPKEIKDLKLFLEIIRGEKKNTPPPKRITIKKVKGVTKMKLRTPKYLYTFIEKDPSKAAKMIQAIPPSLQKVNIPKLK